MSAVRGPWSVAHGPCERHRYNDGMSKPVKILIALALAGFLSYVIYSSMGLSQVRCEVCIEFQGGRECRTATGVDEAEAKRTAASNACALLAAGMTESIACENTQPKSAVCRPK